MTPEQWIAIVVALGGGAGIAAVVRPAIEWIRGPRAQKRPTSMAPPPLPQVYVTHAELSSLEIKLTSRIQDAESDCEQRSAEIDRRADERFDRLSGEVRDVGRGMERALGILEGQRDERLSSGARSRR